MDIRLVKTMSVVGGLVLAQSCSFICALDARAEDTLQSTVQRCNQAEFSVSVPAKWPVGKSVVGEFSVRNTSSNRVCFDFARSPHPILNNGEIKLTLTPLYRTASRLNTVELLPGDSGRTHLTILLTREKSRNILCISDNAHGQFKYCSEPLSDRVLKRLMLSLVFESDSVKRSGSTTSGATYWQGRVVVGPLAIGPCCSP